MRSVELIILAGYRICPSAMSFKCLEPLRMPVRFLISVCIRTVGGAEDAPGGDRTI